MSDLCKCPECEKLYKGEIKDNMECDRCGYQNTCHDCLKPKVWGYICTCDMIQVEHKCTSGVVTKIK